ncbi:MAG: substrate-binding domain-containing protein [Anaerolineales bacterium]|nr:substrate-binding domain-containing protein [Anaerolineales bacterium]
MAKHVLLLACMLGLTACTAAVVEPVEPVRVAVSAAAAGAMHPWLQSDQTRVEVLPAGAALEAVEAGEADMVIAYTPPPQSWFVTPLVRDALVVVVHPDSAVLDISLEDLAGLYRGAIRNWDEIEGPDQPVQPVLPFAGDEIRLQLEGILGEDSAAVRSLLAPTPEAVLEAVSETPGAFGFIPYSLLSDSVRVVRVAGIRPGPTTIAAGTYPLSLDILAMAPEEPVGAARAWLGELQLQIAESGAAQDGD